MMWGDMPRAPTNVGGGVRDIANCGRRPDLCILIVVEVGRMSTDADYSPRGQTICESEE